MEGNLVPGGYGNTPPEIPCPKALIACVDWLAVTFSSAQNVVEICSLLKMKISDFDYRDFARNGYAESYNFNNEITISFGHSPKSPDIGIHMEITGQGCRYLESFWRDGYNWTDYFNLLKMYGYMNITRLDVAIDDFKGFLSIPTMYKKIRKLEFSSSAGLRSWRHFESGEIDKEELTGETLYLGKGDVTFRFYDKKGEREAKGVSLNENITFWNRYEIQLRHERADVLADVISSGGFTIGEVVKSVMSNYLSFKVANPNEKKKSRWKNTRWWDSFLNGVEPLKLTKVHPERTFYKTRQWLIDQTSSSLAMLFEGYDNDMGIIHSLLAYGRLNMNKNHEKMLEDFRVSEFEKELQKHEFYERITYLLDEKQKKSYESKQLPQDLHDF